MSSLVCLCLYLEVDLGGCEKRRGPGQARRGCTGQHTKSCLNLGGKKLCRSYGNFLLLTVLSRVVSRFSFAERRRKLGKK